MCTCYLGHVLMAWMTLSLSCGSGSESSGAGWTHERGVAASSALSASASAVPDQLSCESSYVLAGSHSRMVDDCAPFGLGEYDNAVCAQAHGDAVAAAQGTRCPEPPPVRCPQRIQELWRGWKCGGSPGLDGTFANCRVQVRVSCSQ